MSFENWRKPLKPQEVDVPRRNAEDLPKRSITIKGSKFLGSGSSGEVRSLEAELIRRPKFSKDPVGWFSPESRELKGFAIKIMRPGQIGEAMESYNDCKEAGLSVPTTYRRLELHDGRAAILMTDLRTGGFAIAQVSNAQAESTVPTGKMETITNFEIFLKDIFDDVLAASSYKDYGILLGGDSIFFLMPQGGGEGDVKHIFADFDRMHNQAGYNSETLAPLRGDPLPYRKEVTRINIETIERKCKEFIATFVVKDMQSTYESKLESYVQSLSVKDTF